MSIYPFSERHDSRRASRPTLSSLRDLSRAISVSDPWGGRGRGRRSSLLDALYATDVVPGARGAGGGYDAARGAAVFEQAHATLDELFALADGARWADVVALEVADGALEATLAAGPAVGLQVVDGALKPPPAAGAVVGLAEPSKLVGYQVCAGSPDALQGGRVASRGRGVGGVWRRAG